MSEERGKLIALLTGLEADSTAAALVSCALDGRAITGDVFLHDEFDLAAWRLVRYWVESNESMSGQRQ